ncbi:MAG: nucleotidyl transferase AbiEii/AbiGii toxin family protein [Lachnospiraceae bacterium]|nr:nucleotidyl transferase AbiEii/AbiGii toxin family protein [Lachnospiraceae bacterium]
MGYRTAEQLKGKIRVFAKKKGLMPQEVLQMYMFERVLERLALSDYVMNFILKGGMLISSMFGISERTTMDMDTTVTGLDMNEEEIVNAIKKILSINVNDGIEFVFDKIEPIHENDDYNNFRVYFYARFEKINNPMKIDITTGDVITPSAIKYYYKSFLDEKTIHVMAYNIETIISEKFETIISRNVATTRIRDYYDLYKFYNLYGNSLDIVNLQNAFINTVKKRNTGDILLKDC